MFLQALQNASQPVTSLKPDIDSQSDSLKAQYGGPHVLQVTDNKNCQRNRRNNRRLPPKLHRHEERKIKVPALNHTPAAQKGDGPDIHARGPDKTHDHQPVPGGNLHSHHNQLIQHKHRKRHAKHARKLHTCIRPNAHQRLTQALNNRALIQTDRDPDKKRLVAQTAPGFKLRVQLRVQIGHALVDVAVQDERENRPHGVDGGVADEEPVLVEGVGGEGGADAVDGLADRYNQAAVDDELGEFGAAIARC
ncbi:hypothetical protein OPT61_g9443 [Boeremia exigua]|uniref:Uncharacterized protein n=1 Tax=Boeremia exigua TaxID=749465 RepID=A0ACC2HUX0_9PLEO|nr:hypothetical protein OPT61_g9443 [Boeremia exigua]